MVFYGVFIGVCVIVNGVFDECVQDVFVCVMDFVFVKI